LKKLLFIFICLPIFSLAQTDLFKEKMLSSLDLCVLGDKQDWLNNDSVSHNRLKLSSCSTCNIHKHSEQYYICYSSLDWCGSRGCSVFLISDLDNKFVIVDEIFGDMWFESGKIFFGEKFHAKCGHRIYLTKEIEIVNERFNVKSIYNYSHDNHHTGKPCNYETYKEEYFDYLNRQ
tara:strand:- start:4 stop:531 length:528 start_codon:yes stop_codon:yes gene_type:complete